MVMRKPIDNAAPDIAPIKTVGSFHVQDARQQLLPSASDSETPNSAWAAEVSDAFKEPAIPDPPSLLQPALRAQQSESALPLSLQAGAGRPARPSMEPSKSSNEHIPESLRPGPPSDTPRSSQETERSNIISTNPFRKQHSGQSSLQGGESSAVAWSGNSSTPPVPSAPPPPIPTSEDPPSNILEDLSIESSGSNPWEPAPPLAAPNYLQTASEDNATKAWGLLPPSREPPAPPGRLPPPIPLDRRSSVSSQDSDDWNDERTRQASQLRSTQLESVSPIHEEQNAWEEGYVEPLKPDTLKQAERAELVESAGGEINGWEDPGPSSGVININPSHTLIDIEQDKAVPPLPPRLEPEQAPSKPPRPTQASDEERQKKETYEIKKISWHDITASFNPRISPILVQNSNGPCPLLALVNALTLSTPANVETALVETLRSREQVSLGLLLDAVLDELMSGRRSDGMQVLPDVGDLYSFLITLHTGMNVNPKFFPSKATNSVNDPRNSMSHVHPVDRESLLPGTFEETREMKLYGTFSIPLIHGWLPLPESPAYTALLRSARSYEDAQNIMFREEELEEKLSRESLSFEEQTTLEDISTIKAFLASNPTQLTANGLETITTSMIPGSVAILFRNDHFSTLYRHPGTMQLLQLVTDMGYAGHDEVVWESLVDVNGENCEFFSGDFRIVGENSGYQSAEEEWTTVQGRSKNKGKSGDPGPSSMDQQYDPPPGPPPHWEKLQSPTIEQEDHDLALALQLQEEEEQKQRNDIARRKKEAEYSRKYIEQQAGTGASIPVTTHGGGSSSMRGARNRAPSRGNPVSTATSSITAGRGRTVSNSNTSTRPNIPPRRGMASASTSTVNASSIPPLTIRPVDPEAGEDAPPPSYEMASAEAAYIPPVNHHAHPSASPSVAAAAAANLHNQNHNANAAPAARRRGNFSQANGNVVYEGNGRRRTASGGAMLNNLANVNSNSPMGNEQVGGSRKDRESCNVM